MSKALQTNREALRYLSIARPIYQRAILKVADRTLDSDIKVE